MIGSPNLPFRLGCPVWNCPNWSGVVYPEETPKPKWLYHYTRMFNTVEVNSTFYGLPSIDVARRWANESVDGFRFALKVPRSISHDSVLVNCRRELSDFLRFAEVLHESDRLGPSFLQLPPTFGTDGFDVLRRFVGHLPNGLPWSVEVRHHGWFDQSVHEQRLNELLRESGIDKVLFDSRPLFQSAPDDAIENVSQQRKPRTPVRQTVTGRHPMLRLVGRNRLTLVERYVQQWLPIVAGWIAKGFEPYVLTHAPDDSFAPSFARLFFKRFCEFAESPDIRLDQLPSEPDVPLQPRLFD